MNPPNSTNRAAKTGPPVPVTRGLVVLFGVALGVRLLMVVWFHGLTPQIDDARQYDDIAMQLVEHGRFATGSGELTSIRPPLFPWMVAGIYQLAGPQNYTAVRLVQVALSMLTLWIIYLLASRLYDPRVGLAAATLYAFYPSLLFQNVLLLTETLFTLLLCGACLALQAFLNSGKLWQAAAVGVMLALGALTRSVLWLFPPFLLLYLLLALRGQPATRRLAAAAVALVAFAVVLAPWSYRNTTLQKSFTTVDVMGGRNFMMGNYEHTPLYRAWDAISYQDERAWYQVLARERQDRSPLTQGQLDKLAMKRGLSYVFAHPAQTTQRDIVKFLNFWQLERSVAEGLARGYWGEIPKVLVLATAVLIVISYAAVILACVCGFCLLPPRDLRLHAFLLLLVGFICAVHTAVFGHARYHLPVMPLAMVYATACWVHRDRLRFDWRRYRTWIAAAVCLLLVGSWVWEVAVVEADKIKSRIWGDRARTAASRPTEKQLPAPSPRSPLPRTPLPNERSAMEYQTRQWLGAKGRKDKLPVKGPAAD